MKKNKSKNKNLPQCIFQRKPGSGVYWVRLRLGKDKRKTVKAGTLSDAKDLLVKLQRNKLLQKNLPEKLHKNKFTFGELVKDALNHSSDENGDGQTYSLGKKYKLIGKDFNDCIASDITKQDITEWLLEKSKERKWSPAARNRYKNAFSLVFSVAMDNEKLTSNPVSLVKSKPENNERIRFLSKDEEQRLIAVIKEKYPHYLPAFIISINTGMRRSEQFGLKWNQVSLTRKDIFLPKTKNGKGRHISMNPLVLAAFRELERRQPEYKDDEYVFLSNSNNRRPMPKTTTSDWFFPMLRDAGIKPGSKVGPEGYYWHCNRHTFASNLVMAKWDLSVVMRLMGHKTIQMTLRYAHLNPQHTQDAVDGLVTPEIAAKLSNGELFGPATGAPENTVPAESVA